MTLSLIFWRTSLILASILSHWSPSPRMVAICPALDTSLSIRPPTKSTTFRTASWTIGLKSLRASFNAALSLAISIIPYAMSSIASSAIASSTCSDVISSATVTFSLSRISARTLSMTTLTFCQVPLIPRMLKIFSALSISRSSRSPTKSRALFTRVRTIGLKSFNASFKYLRRTSILIESP